MDPAPGAMNSEELVVVDERTDSGSENSAFEEYEEFEEVSASSDGRHDETELSATFGEMRGKLAALRARMDAPPPPPRHDSEGSLSPAAAEDDVPARAVPPVAADALASPPVPAEDDHVTALAAAKALPREYAVKAPGALVRAGLAMASARTRQLAPGDVITVEEVAVAPEGVPRARVSAPFAGWLSCKCVQGGEALAVIALRPPTPPPELRPPTPPPEAPQAAEPARRDPLREKRASDMEATPPKAPLMLDTLESPQTPQQLEELQAAARKIVKLDEDERRAKAREDILAFYALHNPEKLPGSPDVIAKYKDQGIHEPELLAAIVKKYTREGRLNTSGLPPASPEVTSPALKVPVTPVEAARMRAIVLSKDELSVGPSPSRSPTIRGKRYVSPTNLRLGAAAAPTAASAPVARRLDTTGTDGLLRHAWARGLTPSSPAAVSNTTAVNASPSIVPEPLTQDRGTASPEALLDAVFGGFDDDGGATSPSGPWTPVALRTGAAARSPEHPLSAGRGGPEAGAGPPASPGAPPPSPGVPTLTALAAAASPPAATPPAVAPFATAPTAPAVVQAENRLLTFGQPWLAGAPADDASSSSSAVIELPVHRPQGSAASPTGIPRLALAPRSTPEPPPPAAAPVMVAQTAAAQTPALAPAPAPSSKDTPSAASATDSAALPADAAAAIVRARAEANAPAAPFARPEQAEAPALAPLGDEALRRAFESADANANGAVSIIEAIKALRTNADFARALGLEPTQIRQEDGSRDRLVRALGAADGDGDKQLTFSEFRAGYRELEHQRKQSETPQHRCSVSQKNFADRMKFWGGTPSPTGTPHLALPSSTQSSAVSLPPSQKASREWRGSGGASLGSVASPGGRASFGDDVAFLARVARARASPEDAPPDAPRRSKTPDSVRRFASPADFLERRRSTRADPRDEAPDSDDESSSSSAVIELPVHRPQVSTASPLMPRLTFAPHSPPELPPPLTEARDVTPVARHDDESSSSSAVVERPVHHPQMSASPVIPRLMFAPRSPPELPPAPPTETQDVTPVARHDAAPDPGETVSPLSLASQFRLNRRQRFWQQPESAPTPKAKQKLQPAKPVLLEKRTNFMRFGPRHTIEKASKQPRPSVVLSPKTRRTKKRDVDHFDEKAAARCWLEGLRMAEGARDLFAALVTDDPLSPPTSPACPATSPARRTAPAWKMGYANTAHELKPFFTSTPTTK